MVKAPTHMTKAAFRALPHDQKLPAIAEQLYLVGSPIRLPQYMKEVYERTKLNKQTVNDTVRAMRDMLR